ncbi:CUE domain-containing protein 1-like isoform X1 [Lytechinus pictus]|uniref:CUE domain-containing protein 1-like isoform X1 n=1 Tax=Lytechinus pictus TaxID=7653 RepID=UPI0030BA11E6
MATPGGSSSSKKNKKKRNSAPVVSSPNTITYGPPPPQAGAYPAVPVQRPGYPMQPSFYAPAGYPVQPPGGFLAPAPAAGAPRMAVPAIPVMPQQQMPQQPPQGQLDFEQAMSDFKGMFPEMDRDVIETVLRSNNGKVDETIDQLLKLNADIPDRAPPPAMPPSSAAIPVPPSHLPPQMIPPDNFPDQPPPYSPPEPDSPFSRFNSNTNAQSNTARGTPPVPSSRDSSSLPRTAPQLPPPRRTRSMGGEESVSSATRDNYRNVMQRMGEMQTSRQWNPPMVGNLPSDFLRLSVSGDSPTGTAVSPSSQTSQPRMTPGIQQRLDENTSRRRSVGQHDAESNQMLEDEKLALMLQNEEFLHQLQQDPEFLSALERDYHDALREGRTTSSSTSGSSSMSTPTPTPPPRPSQSPLHRQPPDLANRPLPATPAPELPSRPPGMRRENSGSSFPSSGVSGGGMTNGATSASGGLSMEDIEFRNKLNHMGKSSKTKLSLLAGRFQKKKKPSRKYETGDSGANDALLGGESLYEELIDNEPAHEHLLKVRKRSSKKRQLLSGKQDSLLNHEDSDPYFFSR